MGSALLPGNLKDKNSQEGKGSCVDLLTQSLRLDGCLFICWGTDWVHCLGMSPSVNGPYIYWLAVRISLVPMAL